MNISKIVILASLMALLPFYLGYYIVKEIIRYKRNNPKIKVE